MWIIAEGNTIVTTISNNPTDAILDALKAQHPGKRILRSTAPVYAEYTALVNAQEVQYPEPVLTPMPKHDPETGDPVLDANGDPVLEDVPVQGPGAWVSLGNEPVLDGLAVAVLDKDGAELARYALAEVE